MAHSRPNIMSVAAFSLPLRCYFNLATRSKVSQSSPATSSWPFRCDSYRKTRNKSWCGIYHGARRPFAARLPVFPTRSHLLWSSKSGKMAPVVSALLLPSLSRFATSTDKATIGKEINVEPVNADIVKRTMPELLENAPADQFLSDLNFHQSSKAVREASAAARKNLFGDMNMRQALRRYETKDKAVEAFRTVGIDGEWTGIYYDGVRDIEDVMAEEQIILLTFSKEIDIVNQRYTPLPLSDGLWRNVRDEKEAKTLPLFYILGSSGSGKTVFAVRDAAIEGVNSRIATLYLEPSSVSDNFIVDFNDPEKLVDWIKDTLKKKFGFFKQLDMHLSVVIDEAGAPRLQRYFERKSNVTKICEALKSLAASTRLIISGTGVEGRELSSKNEVYKIRMRPWGAPEMTTVLKSRFGMQKNDIEVVTMAILQQPVLKALSTNARAAYSLLRSVEDAYSMVRRPVHLVDTLRELAPSLVDSAVKFYIRNNALHDLVSRQRKWEYFCVAASVFLAVQAGRNRMEEPVFLELPYHLQHVARCLVDLNLESEDDVTRSVTPEEKRTVLVSPAIVIVLYHLLGVRSASLANWDVQQMVTALEEFREQVLAIYKPHVEASLKIQHGRAEQMGCAVNEVRWKLTSSDEKSSYGQLICDELKGLSSKLEKLELVRLNKVVPEPRAERNILVPSLGKDVIWINGGKASFADVVTQYKLYLCKHCTTDEALTINLKKELDKCGLLKGPRRPPRFRAGHIVMRALLQQWNNNDCTWAVAESRYASNPIQFSDSRATKRAFDSFPTNLLDAPYKLDDVPYVAVTCDRSTKRWTVNRKELGGMNLTKELRFVISTNTDNIQVSLGDGKPVQLPVVEGKVDMEALTSGDRKRYLAFLNQVVDGVVVEFLVTGR